MTMMNKDEVTFALNGVWKSDEDGNRVSFVGGDIPPADKDGVQFVGFSLKWIDDLSLWYLDVPELGISGYLTELLEEKFTVQESYGHGLSMPVRALQFIRDRP